MSQIELSETALSLSGFRERKGKRERGLDFEKCEGLERSGDLLKFKIGCDEDSEQHCKCGPLTETFYKGRP